MSDSYRPPSGPKGSRVPLPPQSSSKNWSGPKSKGDSYYDQQHPKRFKERDNYRPNIVEKGRPPNVHPARESLYERPSGPSGYKSYNSESKYRGNPILSGYRESRTGSSYYKDRDSRGAPFNKDPRGTSKDVHNSTFKDQQVGQKRSYPESRVNQIPLKKREFNPKDTSNFKEEHGLRANLTKTPKVPQPNALHEQKPPAKRYKAAVIRKLSQHQIYLVFNVRNSDLYRRVQQVGEGTYGKVYKAKHEVTKEYVAIKKLRLETEREGFPITAMREIKLLQSFDHVNIVGLLEMMVERNQITMIFDYLNHDLTGLLTLLELQLTEGHKKMIFKQLMDGLNYLHERRVIHRDIKGSNILLDSEGVLKIADFGLARNMKTLKDGTSPDYTNRVITIWYRPPELLMGATNYGREVDIWGVGCLLIELYTRTAIFQGVEEISQLFKIYDIMGTPTEESWPYIENLPWFEMLKPKINRRSRFEQDYKKLMTEDSFDLASKMLTLHPGSRITAKESLEHPYFTNEPKPEKLTFMQTLQGEWHEFETKKKRRDERKRLQSLKNSKEKESALGAQDAPESMPQTASTQTPLEHSAKAGVPESEAPESEGPVPEQDDDTEKHFHSEEGNDIQTAGDVSMTPASDP